MLVRSCNPLQLVPLPFGGGNNQSLWFTLVNPLFEAPTKKMRAVLPQEVSAGCVQQFAGFGHSDQWHLPLEELCCIVVHEFSRNSKQPKLEYVL